MLHYKEIPPKETVKNIKNFFENKNFTIKINNCFETEAKTWTCTILLYFDKQLILFSNGKGINKEFCLASGFAELYERFCNRVFYISNPFIFNRVIENNLKNKKYYLNKNEKIYEIDKLYENKKYKNIFNSKDAEVDYLIKEYYKKVFNNKYIGLPAYNINNNKDILYLDPRYLYIGQNTSGMSAGNSLEEALNQAISEVFEHYVTDQIYDNKNKFYALKLDKINNNKLKNIINKIKKDGNELYILDCSYTFNLPVLMAILVNKKNLSISINLGSFPIFDIALERVLTELYQNIKSYNEAGYQTVIPNRNYNNILYKKTSFSHHISSSPWFNEDIILNMEYKESPNYKIFLQDNNKDFNNKNILNYYKDLCKKNKINIYYIDNSQDEKIFAIQLYCKNLSHFTQNEEITKYNNKYRKETFLYLNFLYDFYYKLLNENKYDFTILKNLTPIVLSEKYYNNISLWEVYVHLNNSFELPYFSKTKDIIKDIIYFLKEEKENISFLSKISENNFYTQYFKKYLLMYNYISSSKYSLQELKKFFDSLKLNYNSNEILNITDKYFLVKEIFFKTYFDEFTDKKFEKYIQNI